jgi:hypothetical protein
VACTSGKTVNKSVDQNKENLQADSIAIVSFNISRDTIINKTAILLIDKNITSGRLKPTGLHAEKGENYLLVYQYTGESLIDSQVIEHPLFHNVEYLANENGFGIKEVKLDKADFFIRLQLKGPENKIVIFEKLKNRNIKNLGTFTL